MKLSIFRGRQHVKETPRTEVHIHIDGMPSPEALARQVQAAMARYAARTGAHRSMS